MNHSKYCRFAWFNVLYCLGVILWGAFVRATGSGAGCGAHWPLCNGEVLHRPEHLKTLIEFSHRLTSGLSLLFVVTLFVLTLRRFPAGSFQRKAAGLALIAIIIEALIGAMLVLLRLVEHDQSVDRVISISLHLVNTLFLLASLTVTAMAPREPAPRWRWPGADKWMVRTVLVGFALLGAMGAMAALGDTLFPVRDLTLELRDKFVTGRHFLQQIRLFHPLLAVLWAGLLTYWLAGLWERVPDVKQRAQWLIGLTAANLALGVINVLLLAPVWMQIVHLLWAETLWILLVSIVFSAASRWR